MQAIRVLTLTIISGLSFILSVTIAQAQDFSSGMRAFERQDYVSALPLLSAAAQNGDADAQYMLGMMHARGLGTEQDFVLAYQWYDKAAQQGQRMAGAALNALSVQMTPDQIAKAKAQDTPQSNESSEANTLVLVPRAADTAQPQPAPAEQTEKIAPAQAADTASEAQTTERAATAPPIVLTAPLRPAAATAATPAPAPAVGPSQAPQPAISIAPAKPAAAEPAPSDTAATLTAPAAPSAGGIQASESTVARIQITLRRLGYAIDVINGQLDETTQTAIRAYQTQHQLSVDGRPTAALLSHIESQLGGTQPAIRRGGQPGQQPAEQATQWKRLL